MNPKHTSRLPRFARAASGPALRAPAEDGGLASATSANSKARCRVAPGAGPAKAMAVMAALAMVATACGATTTSSLRTSTASATFTSINEDNVDEGAPLNPFNAGGRYYPTYDTEQLAWSKDGTNPNAFFPGLAKSWKLSDGGKDLTVHLQPKARWSDGSPVTATDVQTSAAIEFTQGNAEVANIGSVKVLGPKTIEFTQAPGETYQLFEFYTMQFTIVPTSVFGKELPANIWSTIAASEYKGSNAAKTAAAKAASSKLTALGKKITAFAPAKDIASGPFVISTVNPGETVLVKNPYFWNASRVHVGKVVLRDYTGNEQIWNYAESGQLDFTPFTAVPTDVKKQILAKRGAHELIGPSYVALSVSFDEHDYPYDLLPAREALAHVLSRTDITKVGEPVDGLPDKYSDGMINAATESWLTAAQRAKLNPWTRNLNEARSELKKAGFKEKSGHWVMPNGKPWTITLYSVSGFSDVVEGFNEAASELTAFGIPSKEQEVATSSLYDKVQAEGGYPVSFLLMATGPLAYSTYTPLYGANDGYDLVGGHLVHYPPTAKGKGNWLGTPTTIDGINPGDLTNELNTVSSVTAQKPIVAKLAAATNKWLPVFSIWDYKLVLFDNTTRFTGFPTSAAELEQQPGLWIGQGLIKAK